MENKIDVFGRKLTSVAVLLCMLLSIFAPTVMATTEDIYVASDTAGGNAGSDNSGAEKEKFNYVSLGASNVNGYGMYGYVDMWAYDYPLEKANQNVYGYKSNTPYSYPVLIKEKLSEKYDVNFSQLAISSMRAEELKFLLYDDAVADKYTTWRFYNEAVSNVDYQDNWFVSAGWKEMGYDGQGEKPTHAEALAALRNAYRKQLANADLITIDVGMNNFGVYLQKQIKDKNAFGADINTLDPDVAAKYAEAKVYILEMLEKQFGNLDAVAGSGDFLPDAIDAFAYALVGYCMSFDDVMAWINENNPDADVVVISVQNLMEGLVANLPDSDEPLPLGEIFGAVVDAANLYTSSLSPYASGYYYADVSENGHIELFGDEIRGYNGNPATLSQDMRHCFDVYDNSIFLKTQVQKQFAVELSNAEVLSMLDIQKGMDETGLITFYNGFHYDLQSTMGGTAAMGEHFNIKMFAGQPYEMYYKDFLNFMAYRKDPALIAKDAELAEMKAEHFGEAFDKTVYIATIEAKLEAYAAVFAQMDPYYAAYEQSLDIAYDVMAEIMKAASEIDTVNLAYLNVRNDSALLNAYFMTILTAIEKGKQDPAYNFDMATEYPDGFFENFARLMNVSDEAIYTYIYFEFAGMIGNSFFAHPNANGQKELADTITSVLEVGKKGEEVEKNSELVALKNLYCYLDSNGYVTTAQIADALTYAIDNDMIDTIDYVYTSLVLNGSLTYSDRISMLADVYKIVKNDILGGGYRVLEMGASVYTKLSDKGLLDDEMAFAIVDFVYDRIIDLEVSAGDAFEIATYIYKTLLTDNKLEIIDVIFCELEGSSLAEDHGLAFATDLYTELKCDERISDEAIVALFDIAFETVAEKAESGEEVDADNLVYEVARELAATDRISLGQKAIIIRKAADVAEENGLVSEDSNVADASESAEKIIGILTRLDRYISEDEANELFGKLVELIMSEDADLREGIKLITDACERATADLSDQEKIDFLKEVCVIVGEEYGLTDNETKVLAIVLAIELKYYEKIDFTTMVTRAVELAAQKAGAYLANNFDKLCDAVIESVKDRAPEVAAAIYQYLLDNSDDIMNFFAEYGYIVFPILGYLAVSCVEELLVFASENPEVISEAFYRVKDLRN